MLTGVTFDTPTVVNHSWGVENADRLSRRSWRSPNMSVSLAPQIGGQDYVSVSGDYVSVPVDYVSVPGESDPCQEH